MDKAAQVAQLYREAFPSSRVPLCDTFVFHMFMLFRLDDYKVFFDEVAHELLKLHHPEVNLRKVNRTQLSIKMLRLVKELPAMSDLEISEALEEL